MNTVNNLNQQVEKNRNRFMSELQKKSYIDIQEMPVIWFARLYFPIFIVLLTST